MEELILSSKLNPRIKNINLKYLTTKTFFLLNFFGDYIIIPPHLKGFGFTSSGFGRLFLLLAKVQSSKFEVEKFSGKNSFELWKLKMRDFLVQQGLQKALAGKSKKPTSMIDEDWEDLDARALSTIRLSLADEVLFNIVEETTTIGLWTKLESLYMTKNLSNRIFLKR